MIAVRPQPSHRHQHLGLTSLLIKRMSHHQFGICLLMSVITLLYLLCTGRSLSHPLPSDSLQSLRLSRPLPAPSWGTNPRDVGRKHLVISSEFINDFWSPLQQIYQLSSGHFYLKKRNLAQIDRHLWSSCEENLLKKALLTITEQVNYVNQYVRARATAAAAASSSSSSSYSEPPFYHIDVNTWKPSLEPSASTSVTSDGYPTAACLDRHLLAYIRYRFIPAKTVQQIGGRIIYRYNTKMEQERKPNRYYNYKIRILTLMLLLRLLLLLLHPWASILMHV